MLQTLPGQARTTSSGNQDLGPEGSTKAPKKRTKSGCLTCRKRRIKCGEEKPICKNCSKTKRVCELPVVPSTLPRNRPGRADQSISDLTLSEQQHDLQLGLLDSRDHFLTRYHSRPSHPRSYSSPDSGTSIALGQVALHETYYTGASRANAGKSQYLPYADPIEQGFLRTEFLGDVGHQPPAIECDSRPTSLTSPGPSRQYIDEYGDHDGSSFHGASRMAQELLSLDRVQDSASPMYKHVSSTSESLPSFANTSVRESVPSLNRHASGRSVPEEYNIGSGLEGRLTSRQEHYIQHFIQNVNLNFTAITETMVGSSSAPQIQPSNFWTHVIPSMAMESEPLFHAVMAISALHESNILNKPEHTALMDYHVAIKKLGSALLETGAFERDDLLAACLILAYFETMHGEMVKWGRHLQGACDIVRHRITNQYTTNQDGRYKFTVDPTISDHLIWFHIHQDTIQAILSGNGLFLELEYIEMCPVRGEPASVTHKSDQLRVFLARIGDFASKDRKRKEDAPEDENALIAATFRWDTLMSTLTGWRIQLDEAFTSSTVRNAATPFGSVLVFAHPAIASCQIVSLAALTYLHRSHPHFSRVPAEAVKASVAATYMIGQDIIRILSGIMVEGVNNKTIDAGSHVKAMINAVLPVFLAGVAVQGDGQRDYVDRLVQDVYTFTGWRTAHRVLQGFDIAWQRPPRDFGMPSLEQDPSIEHESGEPAATSSSTYIVMDKFEVLNTAAGVLGRIKVVSDKYLHQPQPQQPRSTAHEAEVGGLRWTSEPGQLGAPTYLQDVVNHLGPSVGGAGGLEYDTSAVSGAQYQSGYVDDFEQHSQGPWPTTGHGPRPYQMDMGGGLGGWTGTGTGNGV